MECGPCLIVVHGLVKEKIYKQLKLYTEKEFNSASLERSEKFKGSVQLEPYFI